VSIDFVVTLLTVNHSRHRFINNHTQILFYSWEQLFGEMKSIHHKCSMLIFFLGVNKTGTAAFEIDAAWQIACVGFGSRMPHIQACAEHEKTHLLDILREDIRNELLTNSSGCPTA
jgi:hypothetical protein